MYTVSNEPFQLHIYPKHFIGEKKSQGRKNNSSATWGLGKHIREGILITIINEGPIKAATCRVGPCLAGNAVLPRLYHRLREHPRYLGSAVRLGCCSCYRDVGSRWGLYFFVVSKHCFPGRPGSGCPEAPTIPECAVIRVWKEGQGPGRGYCSPTCQDSHRETDP